ncbi:hypothetical protein FPQ18DRAFT_36176 [Pyronema domesticum]|nr:hypothetical protein FPQ18DRAFT_36176 [Pyronema domesticum]
MQQILAPRRHYASHRAYRIKPSFSGVSVSRRTDRVWQPYRQWCMAPCQGASGEPNGCKDNRNQQRPRARQGRVAESGYPSCSPPHSFVMAPRCFVLLHPQGASKDAEVWLGRGIKPFVVVKKPFTRHDKPCFASSSSRYGRTIEDLGEFCHPSICRSSDPRLLYIQAADRCDQRVIRGREREITLPSRGEWGEVAACPNTNFAVVACRLAEGTLGL